MRGRPRFAVLVAVSAVAGLGVVSCAPATHTASPAPSTAVGAPLPAPVGARSSAKATTTTVPTPEPASTVVARVNGNAPASTRPGAAPVAQVPGSWYGYPSMLPVIATAPGWVEVREAQRPNESTAWIPRADVTLSTTPYYLVVSLTTKQLEVYDHGYPVLDFPAGIGAPDQPTVPGQFFVAMKVPPPSAGYGPFVLVTSAHSNAITDWEQSGDGIIAIHGPIDAHDDQLIGTTGAAISHGCIRLHDADLAQLADILPGTPVEVVS